jgi:hypothetical protein
MIAAALADGLARRIHRDDATARLTGRSAVAP